MSTSSAIDTDKKNWGNCPNMWNDEKKMYKIIFITNNNIYILYHILFILSISSNRQYTKFEIFSEVCAFLSSSSIVLLYCSLLLRTKKRPPHRWGALLIVLFSYCCICYCYIICLIFSISTSQFFDFNVSFFRLGFFVWCQC